VIDWTAAERIAGFVAGRPVTDWSFTAGLPEIAADAQARVTAYTHMQPAGPLPAPEAVSRDEWIRANLVSMRALLDPLTQRLEDGTAGIAAPLRSVAELLLAVQVGALTGFLAQRVLGQYDIALLDPAVPSRLLLVTPNLYEAAGRLNADRDELLAWVTYHEVTHAVQFTGVPWLRDHLAGMLREILGTLEVQVDTAAALRLRTPDIGAIVAALRSGDLIALVLGQERRSILDRLQATMAVIEGHAEHVMDAVGAEALPSQARLRTALERRRDTRSPLLRVIERLLGLEMKLRQYRDGKRFCDRVHELGGIDALNRVWSSPEALPTLAELAEPEVWMRRTDVPSVTRSKPELPRETGA
jgi:coenzyme F420 biosynthesis associated uncharacterized protein